MRKVLLPLLLTNAIFSYNVYADQTSTSSTYKTTTPAPAAETPSPLTGTFDITSNYIFRGVSNSNNLPAFQGGLTYTFLSTGIYANIWGSNVNFPDAAGNLATVEIDTILGITNPIGDHFTYDINIDRYNYPKAASSYNEFIANATYYFLTAQFGYSTNVYNSHGNGTYYNLGFKYLIPAKFIFGQENVNISGGVGHYSLPSNKGLNSYNDYNLQISKTINSYTLAIQWTDTNGRDTQDAAPLRESHIIGTVTVNF